MAILFDTSIYIAALRQGNASIPLLDRWTEKTPVWLSSVVLEELYAGANPSGERALKKLERDFENARRILVPNLSDWTDAGKILARIAARYGYETIGQARLTNDALIASSATRTGVTVVTANARDFERLAQFCPLQWREQPIVGK
jgi:predicted nucleic acid-binding protein